MDNNLNENGQQNLRQLLARQAVWRRLAQMASVTKLTELIIPTIKCIIHCSHDLVPIINTLAFWLISVITKVTLAHRIGHSLQRQYSTFEQSGSGMVAVLHAMLQLFRSFPLFLSLAQ